MDKSLEELESELAENEQAALELKDIISRKRAAKAMVRKAAMSRAAKETLALFADIPVISVLEGELEDYEDLPSDYGDELVITLESAFERKGLISTYEQFDTWSNYYQDNESVKMTVYIHRQRLEQAGILPRFREEINGKD